jgi:hypothetical protein
LGPQAAAVVTAKAALKNAGPAETAAILGRHAADPGLAGDACYWIITLAREGAATKDLLAAAGAVGLVATALRAHPEDKKVQGHGHNALWFMMDEHPANRAAAGEAGCVQLVVSAMRAGLERRAFIGIRTLCALAENHPANAAAAREAGCVQLVASAMRAYPENKRLQQNGRAALRILEPGHALLA